MKRIVWLDLLRIFSIFFVIMIHVTSINWYTETPSSFDFNVLNFYNGISRFCVPVFVMLSGALLLSKKNIDIKTFYKKNILRLIIALIFWGLFYALLTTIFSNKSFFEFIKNFNEIHYHLEFILAIIGLYIITPIIRKIIEDEKIFNYLLNLCILFAIIVPTFNLTFDYLFRISGNNQLFELAYTMTNWLFKINIPYVSGYLVFFLTGYKLYKEKIENKKIIYVMGIISVLFTIASASYISNKLNFAVEAYFSYNTLNVYLTSVAIFVFFKDKISKIKFKEKSEKIINLTAEGIFGIYLVHELFILLITNFNLYTHNISYILSVPIYTILIFILSLIIIYLIRKIPFIYKYIT